MSSAEEFGVTHIVFVLGRIGFAAVPVEIVRRYLEAAVVTQNADGSIRHHHVLISPEPELDMYTSANVPRYSLGDYFLRFR